MLERFDPKYALPTHKYFSKVAIPSLYARTWETVASELLGVEYFAATADMWSSNTLEPYMSYTVHYEREGIGSKVHCISVYMPLLDL